MTKLEEKLKSPIVVSALRIMINEDREYSWGIDGVGGSK